MKARPKAWDHLKSELKIRTPSGSFTFVEGVIHLVG